MCDSGDGMFEFFGDEKPINLYKKFFGFRGSPGWLPGLISKIVGFSGQKRSSEGIAYFKNINKSVYEYNKVAGTVFELR